MLEPGIRVGESHRTVLLRVTVVLQLLIESRFKTAPTSQIAVTVLQNDALEPAVEHELDPQHERKHHKLSNRGTFPSRPDPTVSCLWIRSGTCVVHSVWRKSGTTRTILHGENLSRNSQRLHSPFMDCSGSLEMHGFTAFGPLVPLIHRHPLPTTYI